MKWENHDVSVVEWTNISMSLRHVPYQQYCMGLKQAVEKIQNESLKKILQLPVTTPSTGLLMETGIWPAKERKEYSTLMLIYSIINNNKERISQKIM